MYMRDALEQVVSDPCETPKSPPGDYNVMNIVAIIARIVVCETPKSPPGDYNPYIALKTMRVSAR